MIKRQVLLAIAGCAVLGVATIAQTRAQPTPNRPEPLQTYPASDAQQREILRAVLENDQHWPMRPHPPSGAPVLEHSPMLLLDTSFALGPGGIGNVYPDPSCHVDSVGDFILREAGRLIYQSNEPVNMFPRELAIGLLRANQAPQVLPDPQLPGVIERASRDVADIFRAWPRNWDRFFREIPDAAGYLQVTRAVVTPELGHGITRQDALIYVEESYGPGCGSGTLYYGWRSQQEGPWIKGQWTMSGTFSPGRKADPARADASTHVGAAKTIGDPTSEPGVGKLAVVDVNTGKLPGVNVQIQQVPDQRSVDLANEGEIPEGFVMARQQQSGADVKLVDSAYHFVVVVKNVGTTTRLVGTGLDITTFRNGGLVSTGTVDFMNALKPGEYKLIGGSIPCPDASDQLAVRVKFFRDHRLVPGNSYAASLDVRAVR